jgi:hypothetical protein
MMLNRMNSRPGNYVDDRDVDSENYYSGGDLSRNPLAGGIPV